MVVLWIITAACLLASLIADWRRTLAALRTAAVRLARIMPAFLLMMVLFAVAITLVPENVIRDLLGRDSGAVGVAIGAALGAATLMPGFIAFPLSGALLARGVSYMVLAAFTTTLMMVGVLTYPLERQYFGRNVTLVRNAISLAIALLVAVAMGLVFGELRL